MILDPSLGKKNLKPRLLNWRCVRILGLTLIMINVHTPPPVFYHLFFSHRYFHWPFFLTLLPFIFLILYYWIFFLFIVYKADILFPMYALNSIDSFLVFLSALSLSTNTVFASQIPPQLSFPKPGAGRKGLKQTPQLLSLLCDETWSRMAFSPFQQKLCCPTTFKLGSIFNYIFHKYLSQTWIATFLPSGNWVSISDSINLSLQGFPYLSSKS